MFLRHVLMHCRNDPAWFCIFLIVVWPFEPSSRVLDRRVVLPSSDWAGSEAAATAAAAAADPCPGGDADCVAGV